MAEASSSDPILVSMAETVTTESMAQDVVRCKLCDSALPQLHCNTCRIHLCKNCVGEHLTSQLSIRHDVVGFDSRSTEPRPLPCTSHSSHTCDLHCDECRVPVCSICLTGSHQGHKVRKMSEIYKKQREIIKKDTLELENFVKPEYEKIIGELEGRISEIPKECEDLKKEIKRQGEEWHRLVNIMVKKLTSDVDNMTKSDLATMDRELNKMKNVLKEVRESFQRNTKILKANEGKQLVDYSTNIDKLRKVPSRVKLTHPLFKATSVTAEQLYQHFGDLVATKQEEIKSYVIKAAN